MIPGIRFILLQQSKKKKKSEGFLKWGKNPDAC